VALVGATLVLGSCSSSGSDSSTSTTKPAGKTATTASAGTTATTEPAKPDYSYAEAKCPMTIPKGVKVDCGYMTVPENREDPNSNKIKLAVARIHSTSAHPKPDPVVQLEGGPGYSSLDGIENYAESSVLGERDLIIWDQRGLGFSKPNLNCPETDEAVWTMFSTADPAKQEETGISDSVRACRKRLVGDGVDLDGYDTIQNAADLADLRKALGIKEWNLRGVSYGSALAIETARSHPEGIHSVLLDSVVPPDGPFGGVARGESALLSFGELAKACADDPACDAKYGSVTELIRKVAAKFDAKPFALTIPDPQTGKDRHVLLTGDDIWAGLFNAMYDESLIPIIPNAMQQILDGNTAIVTQLASQGIPFVTDQYEAMTLSVDCADRERLQDPDSLEPFIAEHPELDTLVRLEADETECAGWDVKPNSTGFNELLKKEDAHGIPFLVMEGRFDPVTPNAGTERVAKALGTTALLFPNAGHGAVGSSDCARQIYIDFMDDPSKGIPDTTTCMDQLGPPKFT
jgi:pimeloyl-ACP methyl ester carboxylesterase